MLPLKEHNALSLMTQKNSLQLWIDELLVLSQCKNINQLKEYLALLLPNLSNTKLKSQYLYRKYNGQPIDSSKYALAVDEKLGGWDVLFNPIWKLLECHELSKEEAINLSNYLPFNIQKTLLSNDRRNIKYNVKTVFKLAKFNSLNALAAILIVFLYKQEEISDHLKLIVNEDIMLLILRLFSLKYTNQAVGFYLIQQISMLFNPLEVIKPHLNLTLWHQNNGYNMKFPIILRHINNPEELEHYSKIYQYVAGDVITKLGLKNTNKTKWQTLTYLNSDNLNQVAWNLFQIEIGKPLSKNSALWHLKNNLLF